MNSNLKWFLLLICLFNLVSIYAQLSSKKGYIIEKQYFTEVQYEYIESKIILPVELNGKIYRFIFDTGAPNIISSRLAEKIAVTAIDSLNVSDANDKSNIMKLVTIPRLKIGDLIFYNTKSLVHKIKPNDIFECFNVDGFIGSNILHNSVVQIVSNKQKLIITNDIKKLELKLRTGSKLKLIGSQKSPYVWLNIKGNGKNQVLLDTGMEGSYDISLRVHSIFMKKNVYKPFVKGYGNSGIGIFGTGENNNQFRVLLNEVKLGNTVFKNVLGETTNGNNSRIGSDFFEKGIATFDFKKKRFYFSPYTTKPNLSKSIIDISPTIKDTKIVVGIIWKDNLLTKINTGDEIIKVNGTLLSSIPFCKFIAESSIFESDKELLIEVKSHDGKIKEHIFERYVPFNH